MINSLLKEAISRILRDGKTTSSNYKEFLNDARYMLLYEAKRPDIYSLLVHLKNSLYGQMIRLEASSVCQLKCRACSTASGKNRKGVVGWGFLSFDDFKSLVDSNPGIKTIELSNWGEIFLNPDIDRIIKYGFYNGVKLKAANGVNLNTVTEQTLENLVKYRFNYMTVSLDGASHETYKIYRRRGSFKTVINNIKRINEYKKKYSTDKPRMSWQFVVFGHNEHEIEKASNMAGDLGMDFKPKLNHTPEYSPVLNAEEVKKKTGIGAASRDEYKSVKKRVYSRPCTQLWDSPQVNWNGEMLGCCVNKFGTFGNVFEQGFRTIWMGEKMNYARNMVTGKAPPRDDIPCINCGVYKKAVEENDFSSSSNYGIKDIYNWFRQRLF
ncbi:MAG: SPASM domain-containing protein [Deltaproteobacteria bacterium]|nr:SPASM domain-containing protein [Deltaproteobacteria bacterium]